MLQLVEFALLQKKDSMRTAEISRRRPAHEHSMHVIIITQYSSIYAADYCLEVALDIHAKAIKINTKKRLEVDTTVSPGAYESSPNIRMYGVSSC